MRDWLLDPVQRLLRSPRRLAFGLALLHLALVLGVTHRLDQLLLCGLFWGAIAPRLPSPQLCAIPSRSQLAPRYKPRLRSRLGAGYLVALVTASLLLAHQMESHTWLRLFPLLALLGWIAAATDESWVRYRRELGLVIVMVLPAGSLSQCLEPLIGLTLQLLLAQTAHFGLHYLGIAAVREQLQLTLEQGTVVVEYGCAGVPLLILLSQLVALLFYQHRPSLAKAAVLASGAFLVFLVVNAARIALMAMLVHKPTAFDYWHSSQGAGWFSAIAILLVFTGVKLTAARQTTAQQTTAGSPIHPEPGEPEISRQSVRESAQP